jgi:hypothetical protein
MPQSPDVCIGTSKGGTITILAVLWPMADSRPISLLKKGDRHLTTIIFRSVHTVGSEPVPLFQQAAIATTRAAPP